MLATKSKANPIATTLRFQDFILPFWVGLCGQVILCVTSKAPSVIMKKENSFPLSDWTTLILTSKFLYIIFIYLVK